MRTRYFSLSAATLLAGVALTLSPVVGDVGKVAGKVTVCAANPLSTYDYHPQQLRKGGDKVGGAFWFPSLYGDTATNRPTGLKLDEEGRLLTLDTIQVNGGSDIEPTSIYSYRVEILKKADGKTPGEARLVTVEGQRGFLAMATMLEVPEFVWAVKPAEDFPSADSFLVYKVVEIADTLFKFATVDGKAGTYKQFYFNCPVALCPAGTCTCTGCTDCVFCPTTPVSTRSSNASVTLAALKQCAAANCTSCPVCQALFNSLNIKGYPALSAVSFTSLVPKVVDTDGSVKDGGKDSLRFYGLLQNTASIQIRPTRFVKKQDGTGYTNPNTDAVKWGSAFFHGFVHGAEQVATALEFGIDGKDKRDKSLDKEDLTNLSQMFAGVYTVSGTTKTYKFKFNPAGAYQVGDTAAADYGDRKPFNLQIERDAFTAKGFGERFESLYFGVGVSGDLGEAGFDKITRPDSTFDVIEFEDAPGFTPSSVSDKSKGIPTGLTFGGNSLFAHKTINCVRFPHYLDKVGDAWFFGATVSGWLSFTTKQGSAGAATIKSIGVSAFEGATLPYFYGVKSDSLKTIGARAFYGATILGKSGTGDDSDKTPTQHGDSIRLDSIIGGPAVVPVTVIGDSAFAKVKVAVGKKNYIAGLGLFTKLTTIGKEAFAGDSLIVPVIAGSEIKSVIGGGTTTDSVITLPSDAFLTSLPAHLFDGAAKLVTKADATKGISGGKFYLSGAAEPVSGISGDAFKDDTVYVPYGKLEAWKSLLTGAKTVIGYGAPTKTAADKNTVPVQLFSAALSSEALPYPVELTEGKFSFNYGVAGKKYIISLSNAVKDNFAFYYRITGPAKAAGLKTTGGRDLLSSVSELVAEANLIPEDIKESGISLPAQLPAGLYVIYTAGAGGTKADTTLLYVTPTSLGGAKVARLEHTWVGEKNVGQLLESIKGGKFEVTDEEGRTIDVSNDATFNYTLNKTLTDEFAKLGGKDNKDSVIIEIGTLRGNGNLTGELDVTLKYTPFDLSNATIGALEEEEFSGGKQKYDYTGSKPTFKNGAYDITEYVAKGKTVSSAVKASDKGTVEFTPLSSGQGLVGKKTAEYLLTATWNVLASYNPDDVLEGTKQYDGILYDLQGSITLPFLSSGDYTIVAAEPTNGTEYTSTEDFEAIAFLPGAAYDIYIIPVGDYKATYTDAGKPDAVYAGKLTYAELPLEVLKSAFHVERASAPVAAPEDEEGEEVEETEGEEVEETTPAAPYVLVLDWTVYNGNASWIYDAEAKAFTVTVPEEVAQYVATEDGEAFEGTFIVEVPSLPAQELTFVAHDEEGNEVAFPQKSLHIGESYDLSAHLKADAAAKFEFLDDVEWSISGDKERVTLDANGVVTGVAEWQGVTVTATVAETGTTASIAIVVLADGEEPESVASVTAGKRSVVYADGKLTLSGFGGTTATVYRLNGKAAARFNVVSEEDTYAVNLTKGFYLVKSGTTVTKIVVR